MKKIIGFLLALLLVTLAACALADVAINETNFPDANFRSYILKYMDISEDGALQDSEIDEASQGQHVFVNHGIASLKGIEFFPSLVRLVCDDNQITSLDVSKNLNLDTLECQYNGMTSLNLGKNSKLDRILCNDNRLTTLNISGCPALEYLECTANQLSSLDLSNNPKLYGLDCHVNNITVLDVSKVPTLCKLVQTRSREARHYGDHALLNFDCFYSGDDEPYAMLAIDSNVTVIAGSFVSKPLDSSDPTTPPSSDPTPTPSSDPSTPPSSDPTTPPTETVNEVTVSGGVYKLNHSKGTATFIKPAKKTAAKLTIKDTVKANGRTYRVTEIKAKACRGMKKLTTVTIGKNVTKIGKQAFEKCVKLKKITIKNAKMKKASFGSKCFSGINAKAAFKVPKKVLKNYESWIRSRGKAPKTATVKK